MSREELIKIIWICVAVVLCLLVLFLILFPIFYKKYEFRNFKKVFYKRINKIVLNHDYLLINDLVLKDHNGKICTIDHIVFAEKYIYVIKDRYYRGAISGQKDDNVWFFYGKKGVKEEFENPMKLNDKRIDKLSSITHFDRSMFISVVLINKNCIVKNLSSLNSKDSLIIPTSKLKKLIKNIESRDVAPIDQKGLEKAVLEIANLKGKVVDDE
ncbi:MAG: nuclease-related domain-containing protein [Bacilli bacterium]